MSLSHFFLWMGWMALAGFYLGSVVGVYGFFGERGFHKWASVGLALLWPVVVTSMVSFLFCWLPLHGIFRWGQKFGVAIISRLVMMLEGH